MYNYNNSIEAVVSTIKSKNVDLEKRDLELQEYLTDLKGNYQSKNIKGVIGTLRHLKGFTIEEDHIVLGLKNVVPTTGILGRWQKLQERPLVICDTAHNEEGLQEVLQQLGQMTY